MDLEFEFLFHIVTLKQVGIVARNLASGIFGHCEVPIYRLLSHFTPPQ
jgi:hypothetical protein